MRTTVFITLILCFLLIQLTGCRTSVVFPHPRIDTVYSGGYTWLNLHLETPYRSCFAVFNLGEYSINYAIKAFEAIRREDSLRHYAPQPQKRNTRPVRGIRVGRIPVLSQSEKSMKQK